MVLSGEKTARIRQVLEQHPEGISITDLVKSVEINRNTAGRYLENLLMSGQVEMRRFGMAKLYSLTNRLPASSVLSLSSELMLQLDTGQRVFYANDPLLRFLGVTGNDLFGKNIEFTRFPVVFEDTYAGLLGRIRDGLSGEEWHGELSRPVKGRLFLCRITPTVSNEGRKGVSVFLEDITDRKRDEERIRKSEARLRSIFRVSPVGIGVVSGRIFQEVNDRFCEMTGYSRDELIGKSARMLYRSEDAFNDTGTQYMNQIRRIGASTLETQWVKKNGTVIDLLMSATPLDPADISGGITFTALDITARNRALQASRESEERLLLALTGSETGMWWIDLPAMKGAIDERAAAILGYRKTKAGSVSTDWDVLSHPDDVPHIHRRLADYLEGRTPVFESEHRMRHASGRWIWVLGRGKIVRHSRDSTCRRIIGTIRDITGRKQAEQALQESEEKYRYLVEQSLQGLTIIQNGRPVFANAAMLEIRGYSYDEYMALSPEELTAQVYPEDRDRIRTCMEARLDGKEIPAEDEFRILRKDGQVRWVLTRSARITYNGAPAIQVAYFDITGRRQAEQALRESEERLRQITENFTGVFYVHDRVSNRFIYVSPAYEKLWKRSCESLLEDPYSYLEAVHPEDLPGLLEAIRGDLEGRSYVDAEYRIIQPDGTVRWIHSHNFPVSDAGGTVYRTVGLAEDITGRRNAEEALRESVSTARALLNAPTDTIILLDRRGVILDLNENAAIRLGKRRGDLVGTLADTLLPPDLAQERRKKISEVFMTGKPIRFIDVNGATWFDNVVYPITDDKGQVARLAVIARDITDRKNAEDALRRNGEWYRTLSEALRDLVFLIGRDDRVEYVNSYAAAVLGLPADRILGQNRSSLFPGEPGDRQARELRRVFETGKAGRSEGAIDVAGTLRWFDHYLLPMTGTNGEVTSVLGVSRDITDRKRAEQALCENEQRYRRLVEISPNAVLVHRDGTIIYANRALAGILRAENADSILGRDVLELIHPAYREKIRKNIAHDLTGTSTPFTELQLIRADGTPVTVEGQGIGTTIDGKPAVLVAIREVSRDPGPDPVPRTGRDTRGDGNGCRRDGQAGNPRE